MNKPILIRLALTFALLLVANSARADCTLNGRTYPEGAVVGGYECRGGSWQKR